MLNFQAFNPDSNYRLGWDILLFFLLLINFIYVPMKLTFDEMKSDSLFIYLDIVPMIIFSIDILIVLNTSYFSKGLLITKKSKIFRNYIRNHAVLHAI